MLKKKLFEDLGFSENAHRIYVHLLENGTATARTLSENLGIPRPSVYDTLKILIEKGLVIERNEENKKRFQVDDVKNLPRLLKERIENLSEEKREVDEMLPKLLKQIVSVEPKIKFYSGVEGVKQVLNDMYWYKDIDTMSLWPIREMIDVLGVDFFNALNRRRIRQNVSIRAIWPDDKKVSFKKYPFLGTGNKHLRSLRIAPKGLSWDMGYWIYADKVAFISSRKESFGFVVHSRDFAEMLKAQFEVLWRQSSTVQSAPKDTEEFLKSV